MKNVHLSIVAVVFSTLRIKVCCVLGENRINDIRFSASMVLLPVLLPTRKYTLFKKRPSPFSEKAQPYFIKCFIQLNRCFHLGFDVRDHSLNLTLPLRLHDLKAKDLFLFYHSGILRLTVLPMVSSHF